MPQFIMFIGLVVLLSTAAMVAMVFVPNDAGILCAMAVVCGATITCVEYCVQRLTGRSRVLSLPYIAIETLVTMLFVTASFAFLSQPHFRAFAAIAMIGTVVGGLCAQALVGNRSSPPGSAGD